MHADTAPKERPTGSANNPVGHTDSAIVPKPAVAIKAALFRFAGWLAVIFGGLA